VQVSRKDLQQILLTLGYPSADNWTDGRLLRCASILHTWVTQEDLCHDDNLDNILDELLYAGENREPIYLSDADAGEQLEEDDFDFQAARVDTTQQKDEDEDEDEADYDVLVVKEKPDGGPPKKKKRDYTKRTSRQYTSRKVGSITRAGSCAIVLFKHGIDSEPTDEMVAESDDVYAKGGGKKNLVSARNCMGMVYQGIREYVRLQNE